jgi:NAD(P)-dependent dehydrogenase (short-subunit alcohol dehydrogenase family)
VKRILITGAAGGIGAATAEVLKAQGAQVLGLDLRAGDGVIACDVRDQRSVDEAVAEAVGRLGGLDVLINSAGIGTPQSAGEPPGDGAMAVIDINLMGPWRVTSAALPALMRNGGRVVNLASGLAFLTIPFTTAYTMSKRGVVAYSDTLRLEYANALEVTTFYPGYVKTPIHDESNEFGVTLEGMVPEESLDDCARALATAATGPYRRDAATSPRARWSYIALKASSRRMLDAGIRVHLVRQARRGTFAGNPLGVSFSDRLLRRTPSQR